MELRIFIKKNSRSGCITSIKGGCKAPKRDSKRISRHEQQRFRSKIPTDCEPHQSHFIVRIDHDRGRSRNSCRFRPSAAFFRTRIPFINILAKSLSRHCNTTGIKDIHPLQFA